MNMQLPAAGSPSTRSPCGPSSSPSFREGRMVPPEVRVVLATPPTLGNSRVLRVQPRLCISTDVIDVIPGASSDAMGAMGATGAPGHLGGPSMPGQRSIVLFRAEDEESDTSSREDWEEHTVGRTRGNTPGRPASCPGSIDMHTYQYDVTQHNTTQRSTTQRNAMRLKDCNRPSNPFSQ